MMSKSYYLVEGRVRLRKDRYIPNRAATIVGLFKTEKLAEKWVQAHGAEFYPPHYKSYKNHFFAILELPISVELYEGAFLKSMWTKEGIKIK